MLILLLIYLSKKIKRSLRYVQRATILNLIIRIKYLFILILFTGSSNIENNVNSQNLKFEILNKDSTIGFVKVEKYLKNSNTIYELESEVNYKVLMKYAIKNIEKSIFCRDTLMYSSIYRKVNKKIKLNQSISFENGVYLITEPNKISELKYSLIKLNLSKLFFEEPKERLFVYCDKLKKKLPIVKLGKHTYRVHFSKSAYNDYHYKNGICSFIEAKSLLFSVQLVSVEY